MEMYEVAANCENMEELEVFGKALENQLDVFPDYVKLFLPQMSRTWDARYGWWPSQHRVWMWPLQANWLRRHQQPHFPAFERSSNRQAHQAKDGGLDKLLASIFADISTRISEDGEKATQLPEANFSG
jgi:hypothetical protein